jgi:hypothetical protein
VLNQDSFSWNGSIDNQCRWRILIISTLLQRSATCRDYSTIEPHNPHFYGVKAWPLKRDLKWTQMLSFFIYGWYIYNLFFIVCNRVLMISILHRHWLSIDPFQENESWFNTLPIIKTRNSKRVRIRFKRTSPDLTHYLSLRLETLNV